jgi:hypothetical protein
MICHPQLSPKILSILHKNPDRRAGIIWVFTNKSRFPLSRYQLSRFDAHGRVRRIIAQDHLARAVLLSPLAPHAMQAPRHFINPLKPYRYPQFRNTTRSRLIPVLSTCRRLHLRSRGEQAFSVPLHIPTEASPILNPSSPPSPTSPGTPSVKFAPLPEIERPKKRKRNHNLGVAARSQMLARRRQMMREEMKQTGLRNTSGGRMTTTRARIHCRSRSHGETCEYRNLA